MTQPILETSTSPQLELEQAECLANKPALNFGERFQVAFRSIVGPLANTRYENQDNYLVIDTQGQAEYLQAQRPQRQQVQAWTQGHIRLAVLDGMGGHKNGREVAERIVKGLLTIPACLNQQALNESLNALHHEVQAEFASQTEKPPGATLLLLEIPQGKPAMLFHVGDSRLYAVNEVQAECLTLDHTPPTHYMLEGLINYEDWQTQTHQQSCTKLSQAFAMGSVDASLTLHPELKEIKAQQMPPALQHLADRRSLTLNPNQTYLLLTDGFWKYDQPQDFIQTWPALVHPHNTLKANYMLDDLFEAHILYAAKHADSDDNSTAILVKIMA